jgi:hypothetical protein
MWLPNSLLIKNLPALEGTFEFHFMTAHGSHDSSVGIATSFGLDA